MTVASSTSTSTAAQNVLDKMMTMTSTSAGENPYLESKTWQGAKPGYFFGTGDHGTGYYQDIRASSQTQESSSSSKPRRSVQINEGSNEIRLFVNGGKEEHKAKTSESLLEQAEKQASGSTVMELTPKGIQFASQALEKLFHKNALQRAQYAEDPQQYMDSELALHDQLQALTAVAANTQLYEPILNNPSITLLDTLTQLLGHENDDIAAMVVSLYLEWLDPSLLVTQGPDFVPIIRQLASKILIEAWETIVSNFPRFQKYTTDNDNDDGDDLLKGLENSLSLMENLLDLDVAIPGGIVKPTKDDGTSSDTSSAATFMVQETNLASWLTEQVEDQQQNPKTIEFQGRCFESLAFLAQREDVHTILKDWSKLPRTQATANSKNHNDQEPSAKKQKTMTTIDAIECMLQTIGKFRKRQPNNENETDLLENACLALSSCITFSTTNLVAFLDGQGIELVLRCVKERVHSGGSALKLLDFVGNDKVHQDACERLVTAGGLKYLFPLFLGSRLPKPAKTYATTTREKRDWLNMVEMQTIRIFYCLSRHLDDTSPEDAKARFLSKFVQDETKCDRLVELLLYYDEKSRKAEYHFYRSDVEDVVEDEETVQLAALDAKLRGGGDLFHRLGTLAGHLSIHSRRCHERILGQLKLQQSGITLVKMALEEFSSLLEEGSKQRILIESYLNRI